MSRIDDPIHVLYVDPDSVVSEQVVTAFEQADSQFEVVTADDAGGAEAAITDETDCVVAAADLPGIGGERFFETVCNDSHQCVLFTAASPVEQTQVSRAIDETVQGRGDSEAAAALAMSVAGLVARRRAGQGGSRRDTLERASAELERLHQASNRLYAVESVEDSYEIAIDTAVDILGLEWCTLAAPAEEAEVFEIKATSERGTVEVGQRPFGLDEGVAGEVYQTEQSRIIDNREHSDCAQPADDSIRSAISVPVGDWGVFQAMSTELAGFDERDRERAELLCTSLATAIERNQRERELEQQNERLDEFASIVSHDLRSPLNALSLSLDLVESNNGSEHVERCQQLVERMNKLVDALLTIARMGEDIADTEPVELATAVETAWQTVETHGAELVVDTDLQVDADRLRLEQLLANLFRNSIQHGSTGGGREQHRPAREQVGEHSSTQPTDLTVRVSGLDGGFTVEDSGPGIPAEERAAVFETGYSTCENGTGFGLRIVSQVVDAHGWTIQVTSGINGGAGFEITGVDSP